MFWPLCRGRTSNETIRGAVIAAPDEEDELELDEELLRPDELLEL